MSVRKSAIEFARSFISDKDYRFRFLASKGFYHHMSDEEYLRRMYKASTGKELNLDHPETFNEKLQWLKLYDRKPEYTIMVDKYRVREYIATTIGEQYLIPLFGVWDSPDEIDFDALPNQFVLKCNHNSGLGMCICKDKSKLNIEKVRRELKKGLADDYYHFTREWPYKDVPRKIICEKYMTDGGEQLSDYKLHGFNGVPRVILACRDRFKKSGLTEDFYSDQWNHLDEKRTDHPNAGVDMKRPYELEEMLQLSQVLSHNIPIVRTDFYTIQGRVYFGEITFYQASEMKSIDPSIIDKQFGEWITLPNDLGGVLLNKDNMYVLVQEQNEDEGLKDYKFFCFNGQVKFLKIDFDRFTNHGANYYDLDGNLLPFGEAEYPPKPEKKLTMPASINQMVSLATRLSYGHSFLRVDFYDVCGKVYFGELTFFPNSGMGDFIPMEWDTKLGEYLKLIPERKDY